MDWFEKLTGFRETGYEETRARLEVADGKLRSRVNDASYGIGELELVSLQALRERAKSAGDLPGRVKTSVVTGDVRHMHRLRENAGALFQVASQFNLLEMVSPDVAPEDGVTRYQSDPTQGPACAIAAGAATIYRNYFAADRGQRGPDREAATRWARRPWRRLEQCHESCPSANFGRCGTATRWAVKRDSMPSLGISERCRQTRSMSCAEGCASESIAMWKSPMRRGRIDRLSRRRSARRCRLPTVGCRPRVGRNSRCWSWRPHTRPRCGPPC